ncbi:MAG: TetR family transcriptional regulator C-terminal domain-containing protein [Pseudomonadota bacterium]
MGSETVNRKPRRQADIRAYRRSSLLRAALNTVAHFDIEGATVARICAEAGASRGLISHYFDNKEELLVAALTGLFDEAQSIKHQIANDPTLDDFDRIRRIAHVSFKEPIFSWETAAAWQAFTNRSRYNAAYRAPIRASNYQFIDILTPLFKAASAQSPLRIKPAEAAMGLVILIDGLWNSLATDKDKLKLKQAMSQCDIYIQGCFKPDS